MNNLRPGNTPVPLLVTEGTQGNEPALSLSRTLAVRSVAQPAPPGDHRLATS